MREQPWQLARHLRQARDITLLTVTHELREAAVLAEHCLHLHTGQLNPKETS